jgi:translocator protein
MVAVSKLNVYWKLVIAIFICEFVGIGSALISNTGNKAWFSTVNKPSWNPPAYLFAPVWTILYFLMGISFWIIWKTEVPYFKKLNAIGLFFLQLFFNFCWSILFFKYHLIGLALLDILIMITTIFATMFAFGTIDKKASWILTPYILWVSFAMILNFTFWIMN